MYRIYTSDSNLQVLDEQGIICTCAPDNEVYVSDDNFKRIVDFAIAHENFDDFSSCLKNLIVEYWTIDGAKVRRQFGMAMKKHGKI